MNRRAFLRLKTRRRERVVELSCERLFMRWADARSRAGAAVAAEPGVHGVWEGEPPSDLITQSVDGLLAELDRGLAEADLVRVVEPEWLSDAAFREAVERRIAAFRERGGRVE
jgi:hypothetical protein